MAEGENRAAEKAAQARVVRLDAVRLQRHPAYLAVSAKPFYLGVSWTLGLQELTTGLPALTMEVTATYGADLLARLVELGAVTDDGVSVSVPWAAEIVETDRARLESYRVRGKKGSRLRWHAEQVRAEEAAAKKAATTEVVRVEREKGTPATRLWDTVWESYRGKKWAWQVKDAVSIAGCMKAAGNDLAVLEAKMRAMFTGDKWMAERASPALLRSQWNTIGVKVEDDPLAGLKPSAGSLDILQDMQRLKEKR